MKYFALFIKSTLRLIFIVGSFRERVDSINWSVQSKTISQLTCLFCPVSSLPHELLAVRVFAMRLCECRVKRESTFCVYCLVRYLWRCEQTTWASAAPQVDRKRAQPDRRAVRLGCDETGTARYSRVQTGHESQAIHMRWLLQLGWEGWAGGSTSKRTLYCVHLLCSIYGTRGSVGSEWIVKVNL